MPTQRWFSYICPAAAAVAALSICCMKEAPAIEAGVNATIPETSQSRPAPILQNLPSIPPPAAEAPVKGNAPKATLLLIGSHGGELEPCGCSGGQLGGQARMKTKLEAMIQMDPRLIIIDAGELIKSHSIDGLKQIGDAGSEAIAKMEGIRGEVAASIFQDLPISVVGLGPRDFSFGKENVSIRAALMSFPGDTARFPTIVRANVICNTTAGDPVVSSAVITTKTADGAPVPVLVTSVIDHESADYKNPAAALRDEVTKNAGKYQWSIVIFHGYRERARAYAAALPEWDLWLVAPGNGSADEKPEQAGGGLLVHAGDRGRGIVKLTLSRAGGKVAAENYETMLVGGNDPDDKLTQEKIDTYRKRLDEVKLVDSLKNKRKVDSKLGGYAGSDACKQCHSAAYEVWKNSKHAHAAESLAAKNALGDPECIKCHVTGWHFDPPAGELTTYRGDGPAGKFAFVSCESCHGPALKHTTQPLIIKPVRDVTCEKCHDHDNSPNFDRKKYWPKIEHVLDAKVKK